MTRTKTVEFAAGEDVLVDMTREDPDDRAEIRYVPTPHDVVMTMIELADVRAGDVVYEPGCGDARVTIAAVRSGAARGVGIDIDPERVSEANANVNAASLGDRIEIRLGDALDIKDLSEATVVFLYMGDEFDSLIRPILWKQLKVGSRVVSHRFTMGDWKPDRTTQVIVDDLSYDVHLWTVTEEVKEKAKE
jgi:precorrin-6B methylase 2